jgi:hypothetical protein
MPGIAADLHAEPGSDQYTAGSDFLRSGNVVLPSHVALRKHHVLIVWYARSSRRLSSRPGGDLHLEQPTCRSALS